MTDRIMIAGIIMGFVALFSISQMFLIFVITPYHNEAHEFISSYTMNQCMVDYADLEYCTDRIEGSPEILKTLDSNVTMVSVLFWLFPFMSIPIALSVIKSEQIEQGNQEN